MEASCWLTPESEPEVRQWESLEFTAAEQDIEVERSLVGYRKPDVDPFIYRSLGEVGRETFVAALARTLRFAPGLEHRDPSALFAESAEAVGKLFDPGNWLLAEHHGELAGLALPQRQPWDPTVGAMYFIGVVPEQRGSGLGTLLHAQALARLAAAGVTR